MAGASSAGTADTPCADDVDGVAGTPCPDDADNTASTPCLDDAGNTAGTPCPDDAGCTTGLDIVQISSLSLKSLSEPESISIHHISIGTSSSSSMIVRQQTMHTLLNTLLNE